MSETVAIAEKPNNLTTFQQAVEKIIKEFDAASPEERLATYQQAGILDENGELKEPYIGIDRLIHKAS